MKRKTGLTSTDGGCYGGSLTGLRGSDNPSSSSVVIECCADLSSQGKRKSSTG